MPRGKKSKARAREKRRQVQTETQEVKDAQAVSSEKEEPPSCSDQASGDDIPGTSAGDLPQMSQAMAPTTTVPEHVVRTKSGKGAKGQKKESPTCLGALKSRENLQHELISRKAGMLMHYLLIKYKMKQPMKRGEMLRVVHKRYKEQFPEILGIASERIQLLFGLKVEEIGPNGSYYTLVSNLDPSNDGALTTALPFPQNGLLMPILGVIFLNGNCASEKEIWEFLNICGILDGKMHIIFGDVRKLLAEDMVQENYLEYRWRPDGDPPCFEYLWGPRAHAETSKMKVLEFLAKINETVPSAFPSHFEEALREEEERAQAKDAHNSDTAAKAEEGSKDSANAEEGSKDSANAEEGSKDSANAEEGSKDSANAEEGSKDSANAEEGSKDSANAEEGSKDSANTEEGSTDSAKVEEGSTDSTKVEECSKHSAKVEEGSKDSPGDACCN